MKALQNFALVLLTSLFIFSSCEKEALEPAPLDTADNTKLVEEPFDPISPDPANSFSTNVKGDVIYIEPSDLSPLRIVVKEVFCSASNNSLQVFKTNGKGALTRLTDKKYRIDWFDENHDLISRAHLAECLSEGNYLVRVVDMTTHESVVKQVYLRNKAKKNNKIDI